jgi:hypothetical protein
MTLEADYPKELQDNQNNCNHDKNMNPTTGSRKGRTNIPAQEAEQPENDKYYDNGPQHFISPFV